MPVAFVIAAALIKEIMEARDKKRQFCRKLCYHALSAAMIDR